MKLLSGVMLTITPLTHGGKDFGLGRRGQIAVGVGEEAETRIGRARIIEGLRQQSERVILVGLSFP